MFCIRMLSLVLHIMCKYIHIYIYTFTRPKPLIIVFHQLRVVNNEFRKLHHRHRSRCFQHFYAKHPFFNPA
ncbi:hypothetical protein BMETH_2143_0 [methanotrophic bacterial endosymbiont of Bathymodiolus sp.]|nr:hypothetical protein BMETH_2143_0 [methanotrophic bacterial endosymbiont of Bathymodiolus sp.]